MVIRIDFVSKNAEHLNLQTEVQRKNDAKLAMPRYVKRLLTQRTLLQNKMAADLSTLISLFLDSKPEKYASYFLDCVNSKQLFNTEVIKSL